MHCSVSECFFEYIPRDKNGGKEDDGKDLDSVHKLFEADKLNGITEEVAHGKNGERPNGCCVAGDPEELLEREAVPANQEDGRVGGEVHKF